MIATRDLILTRNERRADGIFSTLTDEAGHFLARSITHAYPDGPKVPPGQYVCVYGQHELHSGPVMTFEITGVPGHTGILFHQGNKNDDSEGCECLGMAVAIVREAQWVVRSEAAFLAFLQRQGKDPFRLTVVENYL